MTGTVVGMPLRTGGKPSDVNLALFFDKADSAMEQAANMVFEMLAQLTEDQMIRLEERIRERAGYGPTASFLCVLIDEEFCRRHGVTAPGGAA